ncbi:MAG: hypothetical protein H7256_16610 [Bdellovibrio sp.]|nr:hypothetical protein [Bdellovibrio sp.]
MDYTFFKTKRRFIAITSLAVASATTMVFFQNCAGANTGSNQVGVSAASTSSTATDTSVSKNMGGNSGSDPVGTIGGKGGIEQFSGDALLPGFTISKSEISAIQSLNPDAVNKSVVCKLFARPVVEVGETASFMLMMYDLAGKEHFDSYKDGSGNFFKFPVAGLSRIDAVGYNRNAAGVLAVRERQPLESHRLGHAVHVVNDPSKAGVYTRSAEVFDEKGQLVCRTNQVSVKVLNPGERAVREVQTGCVASDFSPLASQDKFLCAGYRILGTESEDSGSKVAVSLQFGSKENSAQANSRLVAAHSCASGRALVSKLKEASDGSYLVENECLK